MDTGSIRMEEMFCKKSNTFHKNLLERNRKGMFGLDRYVGGSNMDGNKEHKSFYNYFREDRVVYISEI